MSDSVADELHTYEGVGHGFFNWGRNENVHYAKTLIAADRFLAQLGYTQGDPTLTKGVNKG